MDEWLAQRVRLYVQRFGAGVGRALGSGNHGSVFVAERNANPGRYAVKFCKERASYDRETRAYGTLAERKVIDVAGFMVPQFLGCDDELMAIEMTIVEAPFLLDFGGAYEAIEAEVRCEVALALYRSGAVSEGRAALVAGINRFAFSQLLGERRADRNYRLNDLRHDLEWQRIDRRWRSAKVARTDCRNDLKASRRDRSSGITCNSKMLDSGLGAQLIIRLVAGRSFKELLVGHGP